MFNLLVNVYALVPLTYTNGARSMNRLLTVRPNAIPSDPTKVLW